MCDSLSWHTGEGAHRKSSSGGANRSRTQGSASVKQDQRKEADRWRVCIQPALTTSTHSSPLDQAQPDPHSQLLATGTA